MSHQVIEEYNRTSRRWQTAKAMAQFSAPSHELRLPGNHLDSTSIVTDQTGTPVRDMLFYPWGQTWRQIGNNYDTRFAAFQQREFNSGLDPTANRMYSWNQGRWLSPDPRFQGLPGRVNFPP